MILGSWFLVLVFLPSQINYLRDFLFFIFSLSRKREELRFKEVGGGIKMGLGTY